jgi:hypothetical protein
VATTRILSISLACLVNGAAFNVGAQVRSPSATAPEEAEHTRGIELRRQHRDVEARDVFRAIYERTREPRALARQASAEAALGDWVTAEEHLSAALDNTNDPWILQNRTGLAADLQAFRQHVGLLEVSTNVAGAEVWIAGARVGQLPATRPLRVPAGTVTFEVRAEGHASATRSATVQPGMSIPAREMVNLTRVVAPQPSQEPIATTRSPPVAAPPASGAAPVEEPEASWFNGMHIAGLSLASLGLVGVGVGIAGLVIKGGHERTLDNEPCLSDIMMTPRCNEALGGSESAGTLAIVGFAAGGALLIGGVVLMIIPGSTTRRPSRVSLTSGPGDVGLGLRTSF